MWLYVSVCLWPVLLKLVLPPSRYRILYIVSAFIPYFFVSAFRGYRVGVDTAQFTGAYQSIIKADWNMLNVFRYEPLYLAICKLLGYISSDPHILIFFSSLFMSLCAIIATHKLSKNPWLSCFLYGTSLVFFTNMNLMRQGMACSFVLLGLPYLLSGKKSGYIFFAIGAFLLHYSSVFFAIICLIGYEKKRYNLKHLIIVAVAGLIMLLVLPKLGVVKYGSYIQNVSYLKFQANFLVLSAPLLFLYFRIRKTSYENRYFVAFIFFMELILNLFSSFNASLWRISWYFHSTLYLFVPALGENWSKKNRRSLLLATISFFCIYALLMSKIMLHEWGLLPYEFFWNESLKLETSWRESLL